MFELTILAVVIGLLVVTLQLRYILAVPMGPTRLRLVSARAPAGTEHAFDEAGAELVALGFEGPRWVLASANTPVTPAIRAVYWRRSSGTLVWLLPNVGQVWPQPVVATVATLLTDGRVAVSQGADPGFEIISGDSLIARTVPLRSLRTHVVDHEIWSKSFGSLRGGVASIRDAVALFERAVETQRTRLVRRGEIVPSTGDLERPSIRLALRILRALWFRPKPPGVSKFGVSKPRLLAMMLIHDRIQRRALSAGLQAAFLWTSIVLSLVASTVVFGFETALVVLVVIAVHELGHYLAMLAFGYRNVHMLALPLVGGATFGHAETPNAVHQAWMYFMGPLPGILIGWVLLIGSLMGLVTGDVGSWCHRAAVWFLIINYLNLIPIPPLDGSRILQLLLPTRALKLQAWSVSILGTVGVLLAVWVGWWTIVVLCALQIATIRAMFRQARALPRMLATPGLSPSSPPIAQASAAIDALAATAGTSTRRAWSLNDAIALRDTYRTRPMSAWHRLALGSMLAVIAAPLALAMAIYLPFAIAFRGGDDQLESHFNALGEARTASATLTQRELIADDSGSASTPPDRATIDANARRLAVTLGPTFRALYAESDGVPSAKIGALSTIEREPAEEILVFALAEANALPVRTWTATELLDEDSTEADTREIARVHRKDADHWIRLTSPEDGDLWIYYVPPESRTATLRDTIVDCRFGCAAVTREHVVEWLRFNWMIHQAEREYARHID